MSIDSQILARIDAHIDQQLEAHLAELGDLCAIPSVAAQGQAIQPCAQFVAGLLCKRGFATEIIPTTGNPVCMAKWLAQANEPNRATTTMMSSQPNHSISGHHRHSR